MDKNEFIEKEKMAFSNQVDSECVAQSNPTEFKILESNTKIDLKRKHFQEGNTVIILLLMI
jgi:hypothetical protein